MIFHNVMVASSRVDDIVFLRCVSLSKISVRGAKSTIATQPGNSDCELRRDASMVPTIENHSRGAPPVETHGLATAPSAIEKFITSSFVYISRCGVNKETGNVGPGFSKTLWEIIIDSRLQSSAARRRAPIIRRAGDDGFAFLMLIPRESIW